MKVIDVTLSTTDKATSGTLSNGNLTYSASATQSGIRATHGKTKGKWYWEAKLDSGNNPYVSIGISNKELLITDTNITNANQRSYSGMGSLYPDNKPYGSIWAPGSIVGIALDLDAGTIEFYKNGVSMGVSHTDIKKLGEVFPYLRCTNTAALAVSVNFGATAFTYPIPTGYKPYNLEYSNKILLSSSLKHNLVTLIEEKKDSANNYVPILTSNDDISSGIKVSASSYLERAYLAFSGNAWQANSNVLTGWLRIQFPKPVLIGGFSIVGHGNTSQNPSKITFRGSNDGVNWTNIDTYTSISWTINVKQNFISSNKMSYIYYDFFDLVSALTLTVPKVEMYERIVDSILVSIDNEVPTESTFIKHGMDNLNPIEVSSEIRKKKLIALNNLDLGVGKTYSHNVSLAERKTNKITFG